MSPEILAQNVPAALLAALVVTGGGIMWRSFIARFEKIEQAIAVLHKYATQESLSNMGDRLKAQMERDDARANELISNLRERVHVLEDRQSRSRRRTDK